MAERRHGLARIQVAATLRRMREHAGVTRDTAAAELFCTVSKIGDLETGRSAVKPLELEKLLDLYRVAGPERDELIDTARSSRRTRRTPGLRIPTSHRRFIDLERQARSVTFYSPELLPGSLQTDAYARQILEWARRLNADEIETRLALRAERRRNLAGGDSARYWCILGEAALRANVGGPAVMAEQLGYLLEWSKTIRHLVIQVMPLGSGIHGFMGMTHALMRFDPPARDILHMDSFVRDVFFDDETDVREAAEALELMKAKAIGREESLALIRRVLREYKEMSGNGTLE